MNSEKDKYTLARTEVKYFDKKGNLVELEEAVRIITTEYDEQGNVIRNHLNIDFNRLEIDKTV